jgi:type I restriction enzyme S subunit
MSELVLENELELPKGWVECKLDDIAYINDVNHKMPKAVKNGVPFISTKDFTENGINFSNVKQISRIDFETLSKKVKPQYGDILYSRIGTIGKVRLAPKKEFGISYSLAVIRTRTNSISVKYLMNILKSPYIFQQSQKEKRSIGVPDLGLGEIRNFRINLSPLNEQKRIASKIEELFSKIDSAKQSLEHTKLQIEQYRISLLKSAFEGKLTEEWREINNDKIESVEILLANILNEQNSSIDNNLNVEQKLSKLPRSWIWSSIKTICKNHDQQRIPISAKKRKLIQGKIPYYGASGIIDYVEKPIFSGKYFLIGEDGANLISRSTPIAFIVKGDFWVNNHAHILSTHGNIPLEFLIYYIASISLKPWISGTAQPKLNQENLKKIPVPLPPLKEQEQIISQIEQGFSLIENTTQIVESSLQKLQTMKTAVLKQAFEGKLVPQDPNDEPASELLERIKHEKEQLIQKTKRKSKNVK